MKNRFARGSLNSCSSELVCIERKGTREISTVRCSRAVPIRGGTGASRRVEENNYRGKSCTKVLSSSVMYISGFQDFNILILLMRTAAASVACGLLGARLVLGLEEAGAGGLCHQVSEGSAGGVSVPSVWQSCSLSCQRLSWVW